MSKKESSTSSKKKEVKKVVEEVKETPKKKATEKKPSEKKLVEKKPKQEKEEGESKKRTKKVVSIEDVIEGFTNIREMIEKEVEKAKNKQPNGGIMFLKSLNKNIKDLGSSTQKLYNQKGNRKVVKSLIKKNVKSGLLKPVKMSEHMYKFTGWNSEEPKSRVDVTRFICSYIKENNLQNPENRRQINPDAKLTSLLNYDKNDSVPLTYFYIQKLIQPHFFKE